MSNVRVPGVAWAILIIIIVAAVHSGETYLTTQLGIDPWMIDIGLAVLIGLLKTLSLGTEQLNQALDIIEKILAHEVRAKDAQVEAIRPSAGMRSSVEPPVTVAPLNVLEIVEEMPARPNPIIHWFVG